MNKLALLIGRWRLFWDQCPECNSDAPEVDTCRVCKGWDRAHWPPSEDTKAEWWTRFVMLDQQTDQQAGDTFGCLGIREPRLKRSWRWILQAYGRHLETQNPKDILLIPSRVQTHRGSAFNTVPVYAKDAIHSNVTVTLGLLDKLRLLLGCKLQVNTVIYCAQPPGPLKTESIAFATFD